MNVKSLGVMSSDNELVCSFKLAANVVSGGVWLFVYDTNRPEFLERDVVGLCVNGNWQVWVQYMPFNIGETSSLRWLRW